MKKISVTYWTRLEPRSRDKNLTRSLRAEVRDPLWMLSRQWQLGEFKGEDSGTAASAAITTRRSRLYLYRGRRGAVKRYDGSLPVETLVERETVRSDSGYGARAGLILARELKKAGAASAIDVFLELYPMSAPDAAPDKNTKAFLRSMYGRVIDGSKIISAMTLKPEGELPAPGKFTVFKDGDGFLTGVALPGELSERLAENVPAAAAGVLKFYKWQSSFFSQPDPEAPSCWDRNSLEYQFSVAAPDPNGGQMVLTAKEYCGGHLDWTSFTHDTRPEARLEAPVDGVAAPAIVEDTQHFIPSNVYFRGMPNKRWWEFEDKQTDFGDLSVDKFDLGKLLLMEFALSQSNDWFILPYPMLTGSICSVKELTVTDIFNEKTLVNMASDLSDPKGWSMFTVSRKEPNCEAETASGYLLLPPVIGQSMHGAPLEEIKFLRDEMANMVWAVEKTVQNGLGDGVSGHELHREKQPVANNSAEAGDKPEYKLSSSVPGNWIPFLPVQISVDNRAVALERARIYPPDAHGALACEPQGVILQPEREVYQINEEEVPRAGAIVARVPQLCRWTDGSYHLWIGRNKKTGKGEGSSGLVFDRIKEKVGE